MTPARYARLVARSIAAVILTILGIIGIFVPIMPQILFFAMALLIFLPESRALRKRYVLYKRRHPKIFRTIEDLRRSWRAARVARRAERHRMRLLRERLFAEAHSHGAAEAALRERIHDHEVALVDREGRAAAPAVPAVPGLAAIPAPGAPAAASSSGPGPAGTLTLANGTARAIAAGAPELARAGNPAQREA